MADRLDTPLAKGRTLVPRFRMDQDAVGKATEGIARFLGTPRFLIYLTVFCIVWLVWNAWGPESLRFDSAANGFTALTLMLSLQASYAAPLILLAQNRQEARDRVSLEHDREVSAQSRADMDFLAREIASLRMRMNDIATRDFIRSELRELLEELENREPEDIRKHIG